MGVARRLRSSRNPCRAGRRIVAAADAQQPWDSSFRGPYGTDRAQGARIGSVGHLKDEDEQVAAYQRGEYAEEAPLHHARHASPGIIRKGMRRDQRMPVGWPIGAEEYRRLFLGADGVAFRDEDQEHHDDEVRCVFRHLANRIEHRYLCVAQSPEVYATPPMAHTKQRPGPNADPHLRQD